MEHLVCKIPEVERRQGATYGGYNKRYYSSGTTVEQRARVTLLLGREGSGRQLASWLPSSSHF